MAKKHEQTIELPLIEKARIEVQRDPGSPFYAYLAEELLQEDRRDLAISTLEAGVRANPRYITGPLILGDIYIENQEFEKARALFGSVLSLDPTNIKALYGLSQIAFTVREYSAGIAYLFQVIAQDPYNRGITEELARRRQEYNDYLESGTTRGQSDSGRFDDFDTDQLTQAGDAAGAPSHRGRRPAEQVLTFDNALLDDDFDLSGKNLDGIESLTTVDEEVKHINRMFEEPPEIPDLQEKSINGEKLSVDAGSGGVSDEIPSEIGEINMDFGGVNFDDPEATSIHERPGIDGLDLPTSRERTNILKDEDATTLLDRWLREKDSDNAGITELLKPSDGLSGQEKTSQPSDMDKVSLELDDLIVDRPAKTQRLERPVYEESPTEITSLDDLRKALMPDFEKPSIQMLTKPERASSGREFREDAAPEVEGITDLWIPKTDVKSTEDSKQPEPLETDEFIPEIPELSEILRFGPPPMGDLTQREEDEFEDHSEETTIHDLLDEAEEPDKLLVDLDNVFGDQGIETEDKAMIRMPGERSQVDAFRPPDMDLNEMPEPTRVMPPNLLGSKSAELSIDDILPAGEAFKDRHDELFDDESPAETGAKISEEIEESAISIEDVMDRDFEGSQAAQDLSSSEDSPGLPDLLEGMDDIDSLWGEDILPADSGAPSDLSFDPELGLSAEPPRPEMPKEIETPPPFSESSKPKSDNAEFDLTESVSAQAGASVEDAQPVSEGIELERIEAFDPTQGAATDAGPESEDSFTLDKHSVFTPPEDEEEFIEGLDVRQDFVPDTISGEHIEGLDTAASFTPPVEVVEETVEGMVTTPRFQTEIPEPVGETHIPVAEIATGSEDKEDENLSHEQQGQPEAQQPDFIHEPHMPISAANDIIESMGDLSELDELFGKDESIIDNLPDLLGISGESGKIQNAPVRIKRQPQEYIKPDDIDFSDIFGDRDEKLSETTAALEEILEGTKDEPPDVTAVAKEKIKLGAELSSLLKGVENKFDEEDVAPPDTEISPDQITSISDMNSLAQALGIDIKRKDISMPSVPQSEKLHVKGSELLGMLKEKGFELKEEPAPRPKRTSEDFVLDLSSFEGGDLKKLSAEFADGFPDESYEELSTDVSSEMLDKPQAGISERLDVTPSDELFEEPSDDFTDRLSGELDGIPAEESQDTLTDEAEIPEVISEPIHTPTMDSSETIVSSMKELLDALDLEDMGDLSDFAPKTEKKKDIVIGPRDEAVEDLEDLDDLLEDTDILSSSSDSPINPPVTVDDDDSNPVDSMQQQRLEELLRSGQWDAAKPPEATTSSDLDVPDDMFKPDFGMDEEPGKPTVDKDEPPVEKPPSSVVDNETPTGFRTFPSMIQSTRRSRPVDIEEDDDDAQVFRRLREQVTRKFPEPPVKKSNVEDPTLDETQTEELDETGIMAQKELEALLTSKNWRASMDSLPMKHKYSPDTLDADAELRKLLNEDVFKADEEVDMPGGGLETPELKPPQNRTISVRSNTPQEDMDLDQLDEDGANSQKRLEDLLKSDLWRREPKPKQESEFSQRAGSSESMDELRELLKEDIFKDEASRSRPSVEPVDDTYKGEIVTETMAEIYAAQGMTQDAINVYEKLIKLASPEKARRYNTRLAIMKKRLEEEG